MTDIARVRGAGVVARAVDQTLVGLDDVVALANKAGIKLLGYDGDTWGLAKKLCELKIA